jgi:hypothetical protein
VALGRQGPRRRDRSHHDHAANGDGTDRSDRRCPAPALALREILQRRPSAIDLTPRRGRLKSNLYCDECLHAVSGEDVRGSPSGDDAQMRPANECCMR